MTHLAYVSMGSNMGTAEDHLRNARAELNAHPDFKIAAVSSIYSTEPQGYKDQPWFMNQVVMLNCAESATPESLLAFLLDTEKKLGRVRDKNNRFGPRCIDLDLLLFDDLTRYSQELALPHPRMAERAFVLVPLVELQPAIRLPDGRRAADILKNLDFRLDHGKIFQ